MMNTENIDKHSKAFPSVFTIYQTIHIPNLFFVVFKLYNIPKISDLNHPSINQSIHQA